MFVNKILVSVANFDWETVNELTTKKLGVEISDFFYPRNLEAPHLERKLTEVKDLMMNFPFSVTMHGAGQDLNINAQDPRIREVCYFRVKQSIQIAHKLGIKDIVFHANSTPPKRWPNYQQWWTDQQLVFWTTILPLAEKYDLTLYLENVYEFDASYIYGVLKQIDSPHIKACFDTGHANVFGDVKDPLAWIETYGSYLGYIHLHNNYGETDQHLAAPFGTVKFDHFFETLSQLPHSPFIVIEVKSYQAFFDSYTYLKKRLRF